ncbi:hypothetical protein ACTXT7_014979 [Hymenolepis weldensis]
MVEKGVNKHPHNTKSSSLMEAIARGTEDISKDHPRMTYASCISEGEITFPPTFKFDKGTKIYDSSDETIHIMSMKEQ